MVWIETPSNPLLKLADLAAIAQVARRHKLLAVADNTFATPYNQRPLALGFDIAVHSVTKYINGHSDMIGGIAVVGDDDALIERLGFLQNAIGAIAAPFDSFLALRGVKTLALRMERARRALAITPSAARGTSASDHPPRVHARRAGRYTGGVR
jgi:cystathionine gamma-lyase